MIEGPFCSFQTVSLGTWVSKLFTCAYASSHSTVFSTFCASGRIFSNVSDSE
jgi:hypothetical protein